MRRVPVKVIWASPPGESQPVVVLVTCESKSWFTFSESFTACRLPVGRSKEPDAEAPPENDRVCVAVGAATGPSAPVHVEIPFCMVIAVPGTFPVAVVHAILNLILGKDATAVLVFGANAGAGQSVGTLRLAPAEVALAPVMVFVDCEKSLPPQLLEVKLALIVEFPDAPVISGGLNVREPLSAQMLVP